MPARAANAMSGTREGRCLDIDAFRVPGGETVGSAVPTVRRPATSRQVLTADQTGSMPADCVQSAVSPYEAPYIPTSQAFAVLRSGVTAKFRLATD
jgi:hypothetical protein